jgi:hypothetical protein
MISISESGNQEHSLSKDQQLFLHRFFIGYWILDKGWISIRPFFIKTSVSDVLILNILIIADITIAGQK